MCAFSHGFCLQKGSVSSALEPTIRYDYLVATESRALTTWGIAFMSQMLCCSNGHHWEPFPGAGSGAGSTLLVCPVCGSREHSLLSPPTLVLRDQGAGHAPISWSGPGNGSGLPLIEGYEIQEELGRGGMALSTKPGMVPVSAPWP